jgi:hypothetical protein
MITTIPRAATPMRRQLLRISSESVKKMALAQRKKAFWRRAEKNGKSLLRLGALKGFSGASDIFSFQSLAFGAWRWRLSVPFFAKEERNKKANRTKQIGAARYKYQYLQ